MARAIPSIFVLLVVALLAAAAALAPVAVSAAPGGMSMGWIPTRPGCKGTIAECGLPAGEEFELGSEVSRRILATTKYISYSALRRDSVPCSRRGASYYNCRPGAQANPYSRSCSAITRCRS